MFPAHRAMVCNSLCRTTLCNCTFLRNKEQLTFVFQRSASGIRAHARTSGKTINYDFRAFALVRIMTWEVLHLPNCTSLCEYDNTSLECANAKVCIGNLIQEVSSTFFRLLRFYAQLRIFSTVTLSAHFKVKYIVVLAKDPLRRHVLLTISVNIHLKVSTLSSFML